MLFLPWLHLFILSGVISSLFSSSILGICQPGEFIFQCHIFLLVHGVLKARILKWFAIPFSSGPHSVSGLLVINFQVLGRRLTFESDVNKGDWKMFTSLILFLSKSRRINECVRDFVGEEIGKMAFFYDHLMQRADSGKNLHAGKD